MGTYEEAITCFCGHKLFDHDEYGPCERCNCRAWAGCLVIPGNPLDDAESL